VIDTQDLALGFCGGQPSVRTSIIRSMAPGASAQIANLPMSCMRPANNAPSAPSTGIESQRMSASCAVASECILKRVMDQPEGNESRLKRPAMIQLTECRRSVGGPRNATACPIVSMRRDLPNAAEFDDLQHMRCQQRVPLNDRNYFLYFRLTSRQNGEQPASADRHGGKRRITDTARSRK